MQICGAESQLAPIPQMASDADHIFWDCLDLDIVGILCISMKVHNLLYPNIEKICQTSSWNWDVI